MSARVYDAHTGYESRTELASWIEMSKPDENHDTTVKKIHSSYSPKGPLGQKYLSNGIHVSMRLWEAEPAGARKEPARRDYETVGYVISGKAELHLEGQMVLLEAGDSWTVPKGALHTYRILEPFTAIEATAPPAEIHERDRPTREGGRQSPGLGSEAA